MKIPRQALWLPVRWLIVRVAAFMMGVAASGGSAGLVRNFRDLDVRRQISADRQAARRDKKMSRQICAVTNPAARAVLVRMLIVMGNGGLPTPSSFALRGAIGHNYEQVNDTRMDSLTPSQERNACERTSRRMSFMRLCIGNGVAYTEYINEHRDAVEAFIRPFGVTIEELLETIRVIGSNVQYLREQADDTH